MPEARFELVVHEVQDLKELAAAQVPGVEAQQVDEGIGDDPFWVVTSADSLDTCCSRVSPAASIVFCTDMFQVPDKC